MMKELVPNLGCNRRRLCDRQFVVDSNVQLRMYAVPEPSRANFGDFSYLRHMLGDMTQLIDDFWVSAVEHSKEDQLSALNDDAEDRSRNEQCNNRVGKRVAEPRSGGAKGHS